MFDNVFFIPVLDEVLIHAPLHGITALVNKSAARKLQEGMHFTKDSPLGEIQKELSDIQPVPPVRTGQINPCFLGLITTRSCNLSCAYCGFGASTATNNTIDMDQVVASIDWLVENTVKAGKKELNIHFFGGEPFLTWDLVEVVIHKARWEAAKHGLIPHFEASTNGVLSEKRARFVGDYFDVVVLSFDGFKEFHDRNRSGKQGNGSFDRVYKTARLWSEMPVGLALRMCVTHESVGHLEEIGQWYCEQFKPDVITFDTLQACPESNAGELYPPDPLEFASHFVKARKIIESYGVEVTYAADYTPEPRHSFCPVGKDAVMMSPDGSLDGCYLPEKNWLERGMDLNIGKITAGHELKINMESIQALRNLVTQKPSCEDCFCQWSCAGGCHVNHSYPNAFLNPDFCQQTKIITACSLLNELNEQQLAEELINDKRAMQALSASTNFSNQISVG